MIGQTFREMEAKQDPTKKYDLLTVGYYTYRVHDYEYGMSLTGPLPYDEAQEFLAWLRAIHG